MSTGKTKSSRSSKALQSLKLAVKIFLVLAGMGVFFLVYNNYMVDHSLNNLAQALNDVENKNLENAIKMISHEVNSEMAKDRPDLDTVMALEFAKNVVSQHNTARPLNDVQMVLKEMVSAKTGKRNKFFVFLDNINRILSNVPVLGGIIKRFGKKPGEEVSSSESADKEQGALPVLALFNKAAEERVTGSYIKAAELYLSIADEYGDSELAPSALFQAASIYQFDLGEEDRAKEIFDKISREYPTSYFSYNDVNSVDLPYWMKGGVWGKVVTGVNVVADATTDAALEIIGRKVRIQAASGDMESKSKEEMRKKLLTIILASGEMKELTIKLVTKYINKKIVGVNDIEIFFLENNKFRAVVAGDVAGIGLNFSISGDYMLEAYGDKKKLAMRARKIILNGFPVNPMLIDAGIQTALKRFNEESPMEFATIKGDKGTLVVTGTPRRDSI
ncbi:MAG: hypothetical protein ABH885_07065 [Candidatus Omnitrophota bacterium]